MMSHKPTSDRNNIRAAGGWWVTTAILCSKFRNSSEFCGRPSRTGSTSVIKLKNVCRRRKFANITSETFSFAFGSPSEFLEHLAKDCLVALSERLGRVEVVTL